MMSGEPEESRSSAEKGKSWADLTGDFSTARGFVEAEVHVGITIRMIRNGEMWCGEAMEG